MDHKDMKRKRLILTSHHPKTNKKPQNTPQQNKITLDW